MHGCIRYITFSNTPIYNAKQNNLEAIKKTQPSKVERIGMMQIYLQ